MEEEEPLLTHHDQHSRTNRIISSLQDSLLSQLAESNPSVDTRRASALIRRRLLKLFPSFNTPTHPPYALMIQRAISGLNEENGSTVEVISDFIRKEYEDLPWAHDRILGIQLGKLCEDGELVCNEGGRYVPVGDDGGRIGGNGKENEKCKGSRKKRKRGNKRNGHHADGGGKERKRKLVKGCEVVESGKELQDLGTMEQSQLSELDGARVDEPMGVVEWTQEKGEEPLNLATERVEERAESEKAPIEVVGTQSESHLQETGAVEAEAPAQELQISGSILHTETICSSQSTALNVIVDSQQPPLLSSKCVPSAGIESSLTQLQSQISSSLDVHGQKQDDNPVSGDCKQPCLKHYHRGRPLKSKPVDDNEGELLLPLGDLIVNAQKLKVNKTEKQKWLSQTQGRGIGRGRRRKLVRPLKNKALLASVDVHNKQLQHGNQESDEGNLFENPVSGDPEQNPLKRRGRGRPRKLNTGANDTGESFSCLEDGILSEQKPNINKMEKHRGRGRPRKLSQDENHCEKVLQKDQAQQLGSDSDRGRGRGRGGSRGRGRGAGTDTDTGSGRGRARGTVSGRGSGRGRGRPRKIQNTNPCEEQLQTQAEGLVIFPNPGRDDSESLEQKQLQVQIQEKGSQQQHGQGFDQNQDLGQEKPPNPMYEEPPGATPTNT